MYNEITVRKVENGFVLSMEDDMQYKQFVFETEAKVIKAVKLVLSDMVAKKQPQDAPF